MAEEKQTQEEKQNESKKLSAKVEEIAKKIEELTVLELADLVDYLEEKFGVSYAPVSQAAGSANGGEGTGKEGEKDTVSVVLKDAGQSKVQVIKDIKELLGIGLKEAKDIVDAAPKAVKENISLAEAEEIKKKLEAAGAIIEIK